MPQALDQFIQQYGRPDGTYPVIEVGDSIQQWPTVVVRFGDRAAVIQFCGVRGDIDEHAHLSIDIHAFVDGVIARAGVFGIEDGSRYEAFNDTAPGTSHGWPVVRAVTVLIGQQTGRVGRCRRPSPGPCATDRPPVPPDAD